MRLRPLALFVISLVLLSLGLAAAGPQPGRPAPQIVNPTATEPVMPTYDTDPATMVAVEKLVTSPANDNFADAIDLDFWTFSSTPDRGYWSIYTDNISATREPGEPNHEGQSGNHSVWWKMTLPKKARIDINTLNSTNFNASVAIYTGSSVNTLSPVTPLYPGYQPSATNHSFIGAAGTTYYMAIDGANGAFGNFGLQLVYDAVLAPPANDNFANAIDLTSLIVTTSTTSYWSIYGSNTNATKEAGEPNHEGNAGGHSAWWKWTVATNGTVFLNSKNNDFPTLIGIYTGSSLTTLTPIVTLGSSVPGNVGFEARAGTTYYIAFDGSNGAFGDINMTLIFLPSTPPTITTQPTDVSVTFGTRLDVSVVAGGTGPLTYQWFHNGQAVSSSGTYSAYGVSRSTSVDAGSYYVVVSNSWGTITSTTANVTITGSDPTPTGPPIITSQPKSQSLAPGDMAQFQVSATGEAPLSFQWLYNGKPVANATDDTFYVPNATSTSAGSYAVTVSNRIGSVTSAAAVLTVGTTNAPVITTQPASQSVTPGATVTFSVTAKSALSLSYQWYFNGSPILPPTNSPTLQLNNVQTANAGSYFVMVSNLGGSVTSAVVSLTVSSGTTTPPPTTPSGGSSGGGGGGGSSSLWFLAMIGALAAWKHCWRRRIA